MSAKQTPNLVKKYPLVFAALIVVAVGAVMWWWTSYDPPKSEAEIEAQCRYELTQQNIFPDHPQYQLKLLACKATTEP